MVKGEKPDKASEEKNAIVPLLRSRAIKSAEQMRERNREKNYQGREINSASNLSKSAGSCTGVWRTKGEDES